MIATTTAHVLFLQPGRHQQRITFRWLPQLKSIKSLSEVLIASLVLQLLNLAQLLVMQQIFDKVIVQQNLDTLYTLGLVLLGVSSGLISAVRTYYFQTPLIVLTLLLVPSNSSPSSFTTRYFDKRPVGELQTRIAELGNIRNFHQNLLTLALDSVFQFYVDYVFVLRRPYRCDLVFRFFLA